MGFVDKLGTFVFWNIANILQHIFKWKVFHFD